MAGFTDRQMKKLFERAAKAKNSGESLTSVFEELSKDFNKAKGSVRNVYYASIKRAKTDGEYGKKFAEGKELSANEIIAFKDGEADELLYKILRGATFGKSVRRTILEMTDDQKTSLRYQNKYRNLLKRERPRVERVRQTIIEDYGKCFNPYEKTASGNRLENALKSEINRLYDRIASEVRAKNVQLEFKVDALTKENAELREKLKSLSKSNLSEYFSPSAVKEEVE